MANELLDDTTPERLAAHADERLQELHRELATIPNMPGSNLVQILRNRAELVRQEIAAREARREQQRQDAEVERRHREQIAVTDRHSTRAERIAVAALAVALLSAIATGIQAYYARPPRPQAQPTPATAATPVVTPSPEFQSPSSTATPAEAASRPESSPDSTSPANSTATPNHAMERTATRRAFAFCVASSLSLQFMHGLGGRRSSYSR
jgi:hypothetical protein